MSREIIDQFTTATGADGKPLSRQRKWQLRQKALGLCCKCGAKAVTADYCEKHRTYDVEQSRLHKEAAARKREERNRKQRERRAKKRVTSNGQ